MKEGQGKMAGTKNVKGSGGMDIMAKEEMWGPPFAPVNAHTATDDC